MAARQWACCGRSTFIMIKREGGLVSSFIQASDQLPLNKLRDITGRLVCTIIFQTNSSQSINVLLAR